MDDEERLAAVGATAVVVAVCRAAEASRPEPWFVDPLAEHVAGIAERSRETNVRPGLVFWVAIRTRFLDELVTDAVARGVEQVALVGAGLDARAFRLPWAQSTTVFEIDRAPVLALKRRLVDELELEPRCDRRTVVADVTDPDWPEAMERQGWQADRPTCWIAEGLLVYLEAPARDEFLKRTSRLSAVGSRLGATLTTARRAADVELFRSGVEGDPHALLELAGWQADVTHLAEVAEAYGRPLPKNSTTSSSAILVDARPANRSTA